MGAIVTEKLFDFSGGQNLRDAPLGLAPNELLSLKNMYPLAGGALVGRGGQVDYNATAIDTNAIKSLYRFYKQNRTGYLLASSGSNMYVGDDATGTFTSIASGFTSGKRFSFASWSVKDKVYFINGTDVLKSYDGSTVADVSGSPPVGSQVEFHADRLWILQDNGIRFSDLNVDDTWQAAALIAISDAKGGRGAFLKSANGLLIAGKTSGLWRFQGSPITGGTLDQFSSVGVVAPWSAVTVTALIQGQTVPVGVIFLGQDGVYFTDGFTVTRISPQMDPLFTAQFAGAVGGYHARRQQYWLSYNTSGGANNLMLVGTKLDTAQGQRIAWSIYSGFAVDSFAVWDGGDDNAEFYCGLSSGGTVRKLDTGAQDAGADYECKAISRYCDFGEPGLTKSVRWIKSVYQAQKPVSYLLNYFDRDQSSSGLESQDVPGGEWDVSNWDAGLWASSSFLDTRTSTLFSGQGRYVSLALANTGDGPNFRIDRVILEARVKEGGAFDLFTFNVNP